jgi:hypothetical protein
MYRLLKDLASLVLPVLCMLVSRPTFNFLLVCTTPHKLNISKLEIRVKSYK